eukprot:TRINITY_DN5321_c0_g1_i3.p1 TRINITY_DN5321_c0_g1~~TRINITY_DN5321_c0_g1_i3.p1  ORF type:complete len:587 (+),score=140.40 TRINITY_DN5321_c0_g1_i3:72-1832(+)
MLLLEVLLCALGTTPSPLSFYVTSASCPLAWTQVPSTDAECGQGAYQEGFTTIATTPQLLTTPDSLLIKPKAQLPKGCLVISKQVYWNPGGSDISGDVPSISVICTITGVQPPRDPPVFVLPPFLAPWDYTKTVTLVQNPTVTPTLPIPPTATVVVQTGSPVTSSPPRGPIIADVKPLSETNSGAGCVQWITNNPPDINRRASSTYYQCTPSCPLLPGTPGVGYNKGRLDDSGWVGANETSQWYEMDAGEVMLISGVVLQGISSSVSPASAGSWASSVTLLYSSNRATWTSVASGKKFAASTGVDAKVAVKTDPPFAARYVRINIEAWVAWVGLRAGILQCTERAVSIGGIQIYFSEPTNLGEAAITGNLPSDDAYTVLRLFGISGARQTLGNPEGFTGSWTSSNIYTITFTSLFNGRIDPLIAGVYIADTANITSVVGAAASQKGLANTVPFSTGLPGVQSPLFVSPGTAPIAGPQAPGSGSSDLGFILAAVIIMAVIICCLCVGYCATVLRRNQEAERHHVWMEDGRREANIRMPGGVSSAFKNHPAPRDDDEFSLTGSVYPPQENRRNPILDTFPAAERRVDV